MPQEPTHDQDLSQMEAVTRWPDRFIVEKNARGNGWYVYDVKSQRRVWTAKLKRDAVAMQAKLADGDESALRWTGVWYDDRPELYAKDPEV